MLEKNPYDSMLPWVNPSLEFNNSGLFWKYREYSKATILPEIIASIRFNKNESSNVENIFNLSTQ